MPTVLQYIHLVSYIMSSYSLLRINASGVHPETISYLEEFNDGSDIHDNIQSLLTYKNKDLDQKWKSVTTDEHIFIEHGTYSMWCTDNKRHQIRTFCDENGRNKVDITFNTLSK